MFMSGKKTLLLSVKFHVYVFFLLFNAVCFAPCVPDYDDKPIGGLLVTCKSSPVEISGCSDSARLKKRGGSDSSSALDSMGLSYTPPKQSTDVSCVTVTSNFVTTRSLDSSITLPAVASSCSDSVSSQSPEFELDDVANMSDLTEESSLVEPLIYFSEKNLSSFVCQNPGLFYDEDELNRWLRAVNEDEVIDGDGIVKWHLWEKKRAPLEEGALNYGTFYFDMNSCKELGVNPDNVVDFVKYVIESLPRGKEVLFGFKDLSEGYKVAFKRELTQDDSWKHLRDHPYGEFSKKLDPIGAKTSVCELDWRAFRIDYLGVLPDSCDSIVVLPIFKEPHSGEESFALVETKKSLGGLVLPGGIFPLEPSSNVDKSRLWKYLHAELLQETGIDINPEPVSGDFIVDQNTLNYKVCEFGGTRTVVCIVTLKNFEIKDRTDVEESLRVQFQPDYKKSFPLYYKHVKELADEKRQNGDDARDSLIVRNHEVLHEMLGFLKGVDRDTWKLDSR